ncbi:katanin p80 WD40 repeat-containing subunit B1-like [Tubulanus polymorphus]|uniref:katanin p80 WD40 repeat-containing subunit B1-like n=1 Tax=Tubulanus polymorphus TaxID=672921 RepID=UPI003DA498BB
MAESKRAWKLQEFVAHAGNVNCLAVGHKSGRVMVTGGEDKKVNMWAIGKPNCIMSLSGHTSPVEAVRFGNAEEMVVAGSFSGALKIWDLEAAKIVRTLTGHISSIRSLDFHPYGDFVASGSIDTNIKLWDVRRKGCLFTYKGHRQPINCLRFSPDGRWVVSAGEDSVIKLWDLTAGKLLTELTQHTGPVNCVEFHPNEFLLASGSSDRSVKFWDLERFSMVSTSDGESNVIKTIQFHPDGTCLYAGSHDVLKVYGWEPTRCFDSIAMGWGKVADIAIAHSVKQSQLIGATFNSTNVSTFVVDLQFCTFDNVPVVDTPTPASPPISSSSGRKSFVMERPPTRSSNQRNAPKEEPEEPHTPAEDPGDDDLSTADITDPSDYNEIFHPRQRLSHSPVRDMEPFKAPPTAVDDGNTRNNEFNVVHVNKQPVPSANKVTKPVTASRERPVSKDQNQAEPVPRAQPPPSADRNKPPPTPVQSKGEPDIGGIDVNAFLPKQRQVSAEQQKAGSENETIASIHKGHDSMIAVMSNRHKNLQIIRALWSQGNIKTALDSAVNMGDQSVIVDLFNILIQKASLWNLDICATVLLQIPGLIESKYDTYIQTGCGSLRLILKNFSSVIKSNMLAPPGLGVDISREDRYRKCKQCYSQLMDIRAIVSTKQQVSGKLGNTFRELHLLMNMLE